MREAIIFMQVLKHEAIRWFKASRLWEGNRTVILMSKAGIANPVKVDGMAFDTTDSMCHTQLDLTVEREAQESNDLRSVNNDFLVAHKQVSMALGQNYKRSIHEASAFAIRRRVESGKPWR